MYRNAYNEKKFTDKSTHLFTGRNICMGQHWDDAFHLTIFGKMSQCWPVTVTVTGQ